MSENTEIGFKIIRIKYDQSICSHKNILVCEETRTVECDKCGIVMDPFEYLRRCAYDQDNAFETMNRYEVEVEKLKKRYSNLTKEIERLNKIKKYK